MAHDGCKFVNLIIEGDINVRGSSVIESIIAAGFKYVITRNLKLLRTIVIGKISAGNDNNCYGLMASSKA